MCGRYASYLPPEAIRAAFRTVNALVNHPPNWNMAPTQSAMVVRRHPESGERHLDLLRWGLVPHFTKDLKVARKPINARSETAASSGMFRGALASRRCLVPVDTFCEQPYAIARQDGAPMQPHYDELARFQPFLPKPQQLFHSLRPDRVTTAAAYRKQVSDSYKSPLPMHRG